jgi:AmiR/NasT family two-component response regulator
VSEECRPRQTQQASKSLRLALRMAQLRDARDDLSAAMWSRTVIDLATGMIMARSRCGQDAAFSILRRASMSRNVKLHEVAEVIVAALTEGELPVPTYFEE